MLRDTMKVIWGARLMAVLANAVVTPLSVVPLPLLILLQLYAVAMVSWAGGHAVQRAGRRRHPANLSPRPPLTRRCEATAACVRRRC